MPLIVKAVVVDLDDTAVRYIDGLNGFYSIWAEQGINRELAEQATLELCDEFCFTFENMIARLRRHNPRIDPPALLRRLNNWFAENLQSYPDTNHYLTAWLQEKPVIILTAGNAEFQWPKLRSANVPYQEVFFASPADGKARYLHALMRRFGTPIAFIDDQGENLDGIRRHGMTAAEVITFLMRRPDLPQKLGSRHYHHVVRDFCEVNRLIQG